MTIDLTAVVIVLSVAIAIFTLWLRIDSKIDSKIDQRYSAMDQRMNIMDQKFESNNQTFLQLKDDVGVLKGRAKSGITSPKKEESHEPA